MSTFNTVQSKVIRLLEQKSLLNVLYKDSEGIIKSLESVVVDDLKKLEKASELAKSIKEMFDERADDKTNAAHFISKLDKEQNYKELTDILNTIEFIKSLVENEHNHTNKSILDKIDVEWTKAKEKFLPKEADAEKNKVVKFTDSNGKEITLTDRTLKLMAAHVGLGELTSDKQLPYKYLHTDYQDIEKFPWVANLTKKDGTIPLSQIPEGIRSGLHYEGTHDFSDGKWPDETAMPEPMPGEEYHAGTFFIATAVPKDKKIYDKPIEIGNWVVRSHKDTPKRDRWDVVAIAAAVSSVNTKTGIVTIGKDGDLDLVPNKDCTNPDNIVNEGLNKKNQILTVEEYQKLVYKEFLSSKDFEAILEKLDCIRELVDDISTNSQNIRDNVQEIMMIQQALTKITEDVNAIKSVSKVKVGNDTIEFTKNDTLELIQGEGIKLIVDKDKKTVTIDTESRTSEYTHKITTHNQGLIKVPHGKGTMYIDVDLFDNNKDLVYPDIHVDDENSCTLDIRNFPIEQRPSEAKPWLCLISATKYQEEMFGQLAPQSLKGKKMKVVIDNE